MKKNLLILTVIMAGSCISLHAQEYATDRSIREQVLNNKQPGALYAPAGQVSQTPPKGFEGSSLKKQIMEGKLGMEVKTPTGPSQTTEVKRPTGIVLPSEMTAEQRQADLEKQKAASQKTPVLPGNQGVEEPKTEKQVKPVEQKTTPEASKTKTD